MEPIFIIYGVTTPDGSFAEREVPSLGELVYRSETTPDEMFRALDDEGLRLGEGRDVEPEPEVHFSMHPLIDAATMQPIGLEVSIFRSKEFGVRP